MLSLVGTSKQHAPRTMGESTPETMQPVIPPVNWPSPTVIGDTFSTSIIHDLRNPLAAICASAEMLTDPHLTSSDATRLGHTINKAARRIRELLADLAGVTQGRLAVVENCSLHDTLAAVCENAGTTAADQGVDIRVDLPERMEVRIVPSRIERVFINLIGNALEAMPVGGTIRIGARKTGGFALIEVEDTGPGIACEIYGRLFEPFVTGKKDGLGLGLALSRRTIRDHGGDMWVEPGNGARFVIRLPLSSTGKDRTPR